MGAFKGRLDKMLQSLVGCCPCKAKQVSIYQIYVSQTFMCKSGHLKSGSGFRNLLLLSHACMTHVSNIWTGSEIMKLLCDMGVKNSNFVYLYSVFNFGN